MRGRGLLLMPVILAGAALVSAQTRPSAQEPLSTPATQAPVLALGKVYADNCASCHGENQEGGRGPALNSALLAQRSDEQIHTTLENGIAVGGMPAFKGLLPDDDLLHMANYLRVRAADRSAPPFKLVEPAGQLIHTSKQDFQLEVATGGLDTPWGIAFLPDGRKLVTERPGRLRIIDRNWRLLPQAVSGTPKTWVRQDGGYFDVAIDPDYARNHWVYLSFSEVLPGHVVTPAEAAFGPGIPRLDPPSMTTLVRGRIDRNNNWTDEQVIYRAPAALYTREGSHYGTRFLFDKQGHLFYSLGERGAMSNAQPLDTPLGKIHRLNLDLSVPADNPFVNTPGAVPSIWSYGHRNPEGLTWDPVTGAMWESEHGPVAGDEINIIEKGHNYGWGVISMGLQPGITKREAPGMEPPIAHYTPTLAPSGITFYTGNRYPGWKNNLFVAGLAGQQLRRLEVDGRKVVEQEVLFERYGRTRDVVQGPDGYLYVLMQRSPAPGTPGTANSPGWVIRLMPAKASG